jgi:hypothetical protein
VIPAAFEALGHSLIPFYVEMHSVRKVLRAESMNTEEFNPRTFALQMVAKHIRGVSKQLLLQDLNSVDKLNQIVQVHINSRKFYSHLNGRNSINSVFLAIGHQSWVERITKLREIGIPTYLCTSPELEIYPELRLLADYTIPMDQGILEKCNRPFDWR